VRVRRRDGRAESATLRAGLRRFKPPNRGIGKKEPVRFSAEADVYWAIAARRRRQYAKPRQEPRGAPGTGETRKTEPALYRDRMDTAYRLYLGARNIGSRAFSERDIALVEAILNEHFHGWTTVKAIGRWKGKTEEALVITFTSHGIKTSPMGNAARSMRNRRARRWRAA
jgi:hypothetical protein